MTIFTPDNEPYLGRPLLVLFDRTITKSMAVHRQLGVRTFATDLSAIQIAAVEIVPQGISIALSMRELVRQAYLFSAGILMRPLIERTGMIYHLHGNAAAIEAWNNGWPRKSQPTFDNLLDLVMGPGSDEERAAARTVLHKMVHSDPRSASFNATVRSDGLRTSASGKELNEPMKADTISALATNCLEKLTSISIELLGPPIEHIH
ncbi:MAG: hypothetical protein WCG13_15735 [Burkholderiales bacterium]